MPWSVRVAAAGSPALASDLLFTAAMKRQPERSPKPTDRTEFYCETKWCESCRVQVRFLMSVNHSFCIHCGSRVRLFSREENQRFREGVERHKWQAS